ncbi:MAG: redoxin domain-containing protein [Planctomycetota bacterium]
MQSVQLQQHRAEIESTGGQIVGISFDSVEFLKRFADRSGITFPLLSDVGSKTIDAYGIRNTNPSARDGVAYHGTFIIDQKGLIRSKLFQVSYAERPAVINLVRALQGARIPVGDSSPQEN